MGEEFWIWLAGFVDGEGCISIDNTRYAKAKLTIVNTNQLVMQWIKAKAGTGSIWRRTQQGDCKPSYAWMVTSQNALYILRNILPYLRVKKQQAELAIDFQETMARGRGPYNPIPSQVKEKREAIQEAVRILNLRSPRVAQKVEQAAA